MNIKLGKTLEKFYLISFLITLVAVSSNQFGNSSLVLRTLTSLYLLISIIGYMFIGSNFEISY